MPERYTIYVVPAEDAWAIRVYEGRTMKESLPPTDDKEKAVSTARQMGRDYGQAYVIVYGRDGRPERAYTYGENPDLPAGGEPRTNSVSKPKAR